MLYQLSYAGLARRTPQTASPEHTDTSLPVPAKREYYQLNLENASR
jgi:hypothetical protein